LSRQQYDAGLITYVTVLSAQAQYTSAQDQLMQSRQTLAQNLMSVFKALGGGWNPDEPVQIELGAPH
jgi:outer membrane protein TolC